VAALKVTMIALEVTAEELPRVSAAAVAMMAGTRALALLSMAQLAVQK